MKIFLAAATISVGLAAGAVQAATMVGSFTFDDNAFADSASVAAGVGVGNVAGLADGDLSTAFQLRNDTSGDAVVEFFFTDNVLFNGAGADFVIFAGSNNNVILVADNVAGTGRVGGSLTFVPSTALGNTSGFGLAGYSFDLSDLGFADGEVYEDGLFLRMGGVFGTVWDIAALNSRDVTPTTPPVPLPAGAWLLLTALGGLWAARRKT